MYHEKCRMTSNIALHRSHSESSRQDEQLMKNSTKALDAATDPLEILRLLCLSRGSTGILDLARSFRLMDIDGSKQITKKEFVNGIKDNGLEMSREDVEALFNQFDTDAKGSISLDEFLVKLRPPMSNSRRAIVEQAFRKLNKIGEGIISVEDIRRAYSLEAHPRYMSGEETAEQIFNKFLAHFETEGTVDGKVTLEEFMNYYSAISVSIDDDCYFNLMMRQAYKL